VEFSGVLLHLNDLFPQQQALGNTSPANKKKVIVIREKSVRIAIHDVT
jgi:hypothetical protein